MQSYSLWILPEGKAQTKLKEVTRALAKKYQGPKFEPHLTLLGPIFEKKDDVIAKTKILAKEIAPFKLTLREVDFSTTYFQCVFVRAESTSSLISARMLAQKIFKIPAFFMPHISLFYGNVSPTLREEITRNLHLPRLSFKVNKIVITPATSDPAGWKHLAEIPLAKPS